MLVCHQDTGFNGVNYKRGDRIIDAQLEKQIADAPHVAQFFSKRLDPEPEKPAWAPFVSAGSQTQ